MLRGRLSGEENATVGQKAIPVGEVAARIRALGIEPHPWGEAYDEEFCANILRLSRRAASRDFERLKTDPQSDRARLVARLAERKPGPVADQTRDGAAGNFKNAVSARPEAQGDPAYLGEDNAGGGAFSLRAAATESVADMLQHLHDLPGESRVSPNHQVGINKGRYPLRGDEVAKFGDAADIVNDIADAGGGVIRQVEACDLLWLEMFNCEPEWSQDRILEAVIPPPADLFERLSDGGFAAFANFTELLIYCIAANIQVVPTLFTLGGGNRYTDNTIRNLCVLSGEPALTVGDVTDGRPSHEGKAVIPSGAGWDAFYWDPDETGHTDVDQEEVIFQHFALNVYSDSNEGLSDDDDEEEDLYDNTGQYEYPMHTYGKECARRKCLAVAAFGQAVGEYLAATQLVIALFYGGKDFREVIPFLECGNEFDGSWLVSRKISSGASEMGSFHALLAGPILHAQPRARLRAAGLSSATSEEKWADRLTWMRTAYGSGIEDEVERWRDYLGDVDCLLDAGEFTDACYRIDNVVAKGQSYWWWRTCFAADFFWPPLDSSLTFDARDMLHQVGHHWYHSWDNITAGAYMDQTEMLSDLQEFVDEVVTSLQERGFGVSWEMSEIGFPAQIPPVWARYADDDHDESTALVNWNSQASPMMQAGMCVRYILTVLSMKPQMMLWHTHMSNIADDSEDEPSGGQWTVFSSMGVRVDTAEGGGSGFRRATQAWRRPSWYAFRRLMWLLKRTDQIDVITNESGTLVLRLKSDSGFATNSGRRYTRAYVAWLDQGRPGATFAFSVAAGLGRWERLSLVPEVIIPDAEEVDENGYAGGDWPDWHWSGWDATAITERTTGARTFLDIVLTAADATSNPAPLCVLVREDSDFDAGDITLQGQPFPGLP